jgi:hypothetical protein
MLIKHQDLKSVATLLKEDINTFHQGSYTWAYRKFVDCIFMPETDDLLKSYLSFVAHHAQKNDRTQRDDYVHIANFDVFDKQNRRDILMTGVEPSKYFDMEGLWISYEGMKEAVKFACKLYNIPKEDEAIYLYSPMAMYDIILEFVEQHQYCKMDYYVKNIGLPYLKKYLNLSSELKQVEYAITNNQDCDIPFYPTKIIDNLNHYLSGKDKQPLKNILVDLYNSYGATTNFFKIKTF